MKMAFGWRWNDFDPYMLITTLVLMGLCAVAAWSADDGAALTLANLGVRQALYGTLGLVLMFAVASVDYRVLAPFAWAIYGAGLLLTLVLIPGVGLVIAGSRRWFELGFTTVQPSEFVKPTTAIGLAAFVACRDDGSGAWPRCRRCRRPCTIITPMRTVADLRWSGSRPAAAMGGSAPGRGGPIDGCGKRHRAGRTRARVLRREASQGPGGARGNARPTPRGAGDGASADPGGA